MPPGKALFSGHPGLGDAKLVSSLIGLGAAVNEQNDATGETPLIIAAKRGHSDVVDVLIKNGAKLNIKDNAGCDALTAAAAVGKPDVFFALVKAGSPVDPNSLNTLLASAANVGDVKTVEYLLQLGASATSLGVSGESPLMAAVRSRNVDLVNLLLSKGANVDYTDSAGRTAVILAAQSGNPEIFAVIASRGVDLNTKDARGNTPMMWSIMMGHHNLALHLIEKNADVSLRNAANKNALYLSAFAPETARALIQKGARIEDVTVEDEDYYRTALAYQWLARFLEREMSEGKADPGLWVSDVKLAYGIAARHFDLAANQYTDLASGLRTKQVLKVVGVVLLNAASIALSSASAHQQAHQSAEISALQSRSSGGSGRGVGYGAAPYQVITPGKSLWESAKDCDSKAAEIQKLGQSCKRKAECYEKARAGEENSCLSLTPAN